MDMNPNTILNHIKHTVCPISSLFFSTLCSLGHDGKKSSASRLKPDADPPHEPVRSGAGGVNNKPSRGRAETRTTGKTKTKPSLTPGLRALLPSSISVTGVSLSPSCSSLLLQASCSIHLPPCSSAWLQSSSTWSPSRSRFDSSTTWRG